MMTANPTDDGNQLHDEEVFLDSVADAINRLQEDGGVAPEIAHRPPSHPVKMEKGISSPKVT